MSNVDANSAIDRKLDALADAIDVLELEHPEFVTALPTSEATVQEDLRKWAHELRSRGYLSLRATV